MNLPLARFNGTHITTSDDVGGLSSIDLFADWRTAKKFDWFYSEVRKEFEQMLREARSQMGKERIKEFLDSLDSAHHDSDNGWSDRINETYQERAR